MAVKKLRREAMHRECMIRISPNCTGDFAVVLCHYRMMDISGMGYKPPDWLGAWGCDACHKLVDTCHSDEIQLAFAHAVFRTQNTLFAEGKLLVTV